MNHLTPTPTPDDDEMTSEVDSLQVLDAESMSKLDQIELEYEEVKANLLRISMSSENTINELTEFAKASQHHLVYQALAAMIKSATDANREAASVIKRKQDLVVAKNGGTSVQVVNNNLHLSTTDAIDLIRKRNGLQTDE